jgi:hypothetical protein
VKANRIIQEQERSHTAILESKCFEIVELEDQLSSLQKQKQEETTDLQDELRKSSEKYEN